MPHPVPRLRARPRACLAAAALLAGACTSESIAVWDGPILSVSPTVLRCIAGEDAAITATLTPAARGTTYEATASNGNVTTAVQGARILVRCVAPGAAFVTIRAAETVVTVPVQVDPAAVPAFTLLPNAASLAPGGTVALRAVVTATGLDATELRWTSSQPAVATVDSLAGVVRGVTAGQTTITARALRNPAVAASALVTVGAPGGPLAIVPSPGALDLQVGESRQLTASVSPAPNAPPEQRGVLFRVADSAIATVRDDGLVTARRPGSTVVVVRARVDTLVSAAVPVTVRGGPLRLTIQSLEMRDPGGAWLPARLDSLAGPVRIGVNYDPADLVVDSVTATLGAATARCTLDAGAVVLRASCTLDVSARDATGRALVPDGTQPLAISAWARQAGSLPGSTATEARLVQQVTVRNGAR